MPNLNFLNNPTVLTAFLLWSFIWKGFALWQSAGRKQLSWFIIILFINTFGILEIVYLLYLYRFDLGSSELIKTLSNLSRKFKLLAK